MKASHVLGAILIGLTFLVGITAGTGHAGDICLQDLECDVRFYVSLDQTTGGMVINGQAFYGGTLVGAITGCIANGPAFAIQYLGDYGLRYYLLYGTQWYTWAIDSYDSSYYDGPRPAQLVTCGTMSSEASSLDTGANY
jgi:hypothetical protein